MNVAMCLELSQLDPLQQDEQGTRGVLPVVAEANSCAVVVLPFDASAAVDSVVWVVEDEESVKLRWEMTELAVALESMEEDVFVMVVSLIDMVVSLLCLDEAVEEET